tara:strand:+ start:112 stop:420 length:309 start_codon:yes stop_codon:yes gene_type:complete
VTLLKSIEDRIVNLQKINSDGASSVVEAELRQLDMNGMEPRQIAVVLAREFGVSLTMDWDTTNQRFSTVIGGVIFNSDFDYKDYISSPWEHGKNYIRSSRRN